MAKAVSAVRFSAIVNLAKNWKAVPDQVIECFFRGSFAIGNKILMVLQESCKIEKGLKYQKSTRAWEFTFDVIHCGNITLLEHVSVDCF
jgi:hypothetical protein